MKFAEIKEILIQKKQIQENTKKHIEFQIEKLQSDFNDLECDMENVQNMLDGIDNLSRLAE